MKELEKDYLAQIRQHYKYKLVDDARGPGQSLTVVNTLDQKKTNYLFWYNTYKYFQVSVWTTTSEIVTLTEVNGDVLDGEVGREEVE